MWIRAQVGNGTRKSLKETSVTRVRGMVSVLFNTIHKSNN